VYDQNVATYRQTVLTAFQDVEDNLASQRILGREIVVQQQAVQSAQQALDIVTNQYKSGTVDYLNVLTAQTTAFTTEQKLASIQGQRMVSSVGLVKALGGGWQVAQMDRETGDVKAPAAPAPASGVAAQSGTQAGVAAATAREASRDTASAQPGKQPNTLPVAQSQKAAPPTSQIRND